jgi:hypothetical protein
MPLAKGNATAGSYFLGVGKGGDAVARVGLAL